jgi:antitoxin component of MazEF toxin-antitoxin module
LQIVGKVGKRLALYPPRELVRQLGLEEGCKVVFSIEGNRLIIEKVKNPWELALHSRKWAETTVKESEMMQDDFTSEEVYYI